MSILFSPLKIRNITLKNRVVVSPMCQYSSHDGFANEWHLVHLGSRATGGCGLVFTEATAISPEGRISPDDLGIWKDEHIGYLKKIADFISAQNAVPGIQLGHAGRKASQLPPWKGRKKLWPGEGGWQTIAPSAVPYKEGEPVPTAMTTSAIRKLVDDFAAAAARALKAGFKIMEIHAAHGYLIHEFLSPLSNHRTDEYGGTFENRIRLLTETVDAVRGVIGSDLPLFVRISASDWVEGGWNVENSVQLAQHLKAASVDLIDCSSGGNDPRQQIPTGPLYQVPFAEKVKKESGICTGAVGLITTAQQAEDILQQGQADIIVMARELLRDPYFPLRAARELKADVAWPLQYERAKLR